jgi:HlyD family secretion protein
MTQERKQMDRRWLWLGALILLILVFFSARSLTRDRLQVHTAQVMRAPLVASIDTNGRVEPELNYEIHSPAATTIKAVYVQAGDQVPAGKLLMQLDDAQLQARLATAENAVKSAQASLEIAIPNENRQQQLATANLKRALLERDEARRELKAMNKLHTSGAASASEVAAAQQRLDSAEASLHAEEESEQIRTSPSEVHRAEAALADAKANLAATRHIVDQAAVRAPIAGTVYSLDADHSEFVEEGKLLLQLADLHHEQVRAYFDEPDLGKLAVGQKIQVKWEAKPDRVWNGHIARVPVTVINLGTRHVGEVLVQIDDADGQLLPDTNVTVSVTISTEANALTVPREALRTVGGRPCVYKVVNGELQKTYVTTGTLNNTKVSILTGLQEGDWVATGTANGLPLLEGMPIKVVQ